MARPTYPSDEIDRLMVRFPAGLKRKLTEAARDSGRSVNSEIIQRLEFSFYADQDPKAAFREIRDAKTLREAQQELAEFRQMMERVEERLIKIEGEEFAERIGRIVRGTRKREKPE